MSTATEHVAAVNGNSDKPDTAKNGVKLIHELDITKLHSLPSEQQDLYLLSFLANLETHISSLAPEHLSPQQVSLKNQLLQIINLQSPCPTRVIRNSLGRCFAAIFGKGDRKILFETINELAVIVNASKSEKGTKPRHAAVHCVGEIYRTAGDSAITLSGLICSSLIKSIKNAQNSLAFRAAILKALGKIVRGVRSTLDEIVCREIWKTARNLSSDKSALVQINACECLEHLMRGTTFFRNLGDFEVLKSVLWKLCDSSSAAVRRASALCLASTLVLAYSESAPDRLAPKIKKPKRANTLRKANPTTFSEVDEDSPRPETPTSRKGTAQLEFSLPDLLRQLSVQYVKTSTTNRSRASIGICYTKVFTGLPNQIISSSFGLIADHLLIEVLSNPSIAHHRYRTLLSRNIVQKLLVDVLGLEILGEAGKLDAAKTLINGILKDYPQALKERPEPSKHTLTGALDVLTRLIEALGSAFAPLADGCREMLVQILQHPSYTIQIHVSCCLRAFVLVSPQQLIQCASICMNGVNRELGLLSGPKHSARRCVGQANGLAAVLSASPLQPLYSSLDVSSRVFSLATNLLKSSSSSELRVSEIQVQVAWILLGGLMPLGPNFMKIHLPQLLLLWRNALPKPLPNLNSNQKQSLEIGYLTHVRECALGSMLSFLEFNGRLVTMDVAKRIGIMLSNTLEFVDGLPKRLTHEDPFQRIASSLSLQDLAVMVRRRVFQCYSKLANCSPLASPEVLTQSNILNFTVASFADPENYSQSSVGSSIANTAGNFESIWDVGDNYAFGISGLMRGLEIKPLMGQNGQENRREYSDRGGCDTIFDHLLQSPVLGAPEHDSVCIHFQSRDWWEKLPDSPLTELVNSAITLFAIALPLQSPKVQESVLEQLATSLSANNLLRDLGRKAAISANIAIALLFTIKVSLGETNIVQGDLRAPSVEKGLEELLRGLIVDQDHYIRNAAYEALGRLCSNSGNSFTSKEVNALVDTIVSNRDPSARAGCAMTLGSIHENVGSMAAGSYLKSIHGILLSLCSDPHPAVHFWAIEALSKVAESAGLTFSGYVSSTLGLLAQLWISDSHNEECDVLSTSNSELEFLTPSVVAHGVDSLVNVLGPDLQDMSRTRELMITLIRQFDVDKWSAVRALGMRCWEHMFLYAPAFVDLPSYVHQLQERIDDADSGIRRTAIDGLYSLMQRNASEVLQITNGDIDDKLWNTFDSVSNANGLQRVLEAWLGQTCLKETSYWIGRCQHILTKTSKKNDETPITAHIKTPALPDAQDEEVAGFATGNPKDDDGANPDAGQELLRWQVRAFALQCLSDLLAVVARDIQLDPESHAGAVLQQRIGDIIRMAFLTSTASVVELRVGGLKVINQVLIIFGATPDPDFSEALLLEQYQAQISSALTPAFGPDSSPELASAAVNVCATFAATGLVKDADRMGRILKLLVAALDSFTSSSGDVVIGDLKGLSSNAQTMIKMAVLSAWAELQVASSHQAYLVEVVKPYVARLTPLWLASLQEFARLRFEPDISSHTGPVTADDELDVVYAALNRQTLLKFYQASWLKLVDAIASLIDQDSDSVFDALDRKARTPQLNGETPKDTAIDYRAEPVAFFFVLYGVAFEALITRPSNDSPDSQEHALEILMALKKILRPNVSGHAIYQDAVFSETMDLFNRQALTESQEVQAVLVEITRNMCLTHPTATNESSNIEHLSDDVEQLFELTRVIVLVLANLLPSLTETKSVARLHLSQEAVALAILSLESLVDASKIFPSIIRTDLYACILHIFSSVFATGACQAEVVPQALPIFKRFIGSMIENSESDRVLGAQLGACLRRFLSILAIAQRRETEASLPCAKNILLASTILLTNGLEILSPGEDVVQRLYEEMIDCLHDIGLAKVSANCLRSVLLSSARNDNGQATVRYLLPRLLQFLSNSSDPDPEDAKSTILRALVASIATLEGEQASAGLCYVLPALLYRASTEGTEIYKETAARLIELASFNQEAFRGVVAKMNPDQRGFMETVISRGGIRRRSGRGQNELGVDEPRIALKLNFGTS